MVALRSVQPRNELRVERHRWTAAYRNGIIQAGGRRRSSNIPFRGDGQALPDVLAGRVPLMMSGYVVAMPHIKAGKLRALAVTSPRRAAIFPDVPTIAEAGYPAYALDTWAGFFAPAGTPDEIVNQFNREISAALATPAMQAQLAATGAEATVTSPAEFAAFVRRESEIYGKLVRKLQLKPE